MQAMENGEGEGAEPGELEEPAPKKRKHTEITWSTPPRGTSWPHLSLGHALNLG